MTELADQTVHAWRTHQHLLRALVDAIDDEGMLCTLSRRGGRSVGRQLAHLQYVRVHQLKKRAKLLAVGVRELLTGEEPERVELAAAFEDSAQRVEQWIRGAVAGKPGCRTMKGGIVTSIVYLIAHESHHRGNILLTLKQCGHPLERTARDGLWGGWNRALES